MREREELRALKSCKRGKNKEKKYEYGKEKKERKKKICEKI
jgi:hypothetical protein